MVGARDLSSGSNADDKGSENSVMPTTLLFTPTAEEAKYWAKRHRTFVASSASGMVASGITVGFTRGFLCLTVLTLR